MGCFTVYSLTLLASIEMKLDAVTRFITDAGPHVVHLIIAGLFIQQTVH